jgi:hypothetical protein
MVPPGFGRLKGTHIPEAGLARRVERISARGGALPLLRRAIPGLPSASLNAVGLEWRLWCCPHGCPNQGSTPFYIHRQLARSYWLQYLPVCRGYITGASLMIQAIGLENRSMPLAIYSVNPNREIA